MKKMLATLLFAVLASSAWAQSYTLKIIRIETADFNLVKQYYEDNVFSELDDNAVAPFIAENIECGVRKEISKDDFAATVELQKNNALDDQVKVSMTFSYKTFEETREIDGESFDVFSQDIEEFSRELRLGCFYVAGKYWISVCQSPAESQIIYTFFIVNVSENKGGE